MAHNLLSSRFYNRSDKPAWHRLGINDESYHSAADALRRVGEFDVQKFPLKTVIGEQVIDTGYYGVFREPIDEDKHWRMLGSPVTSDYELITPVAAAQMWDENVRDAEGNPAAVETLGILGRGHRLFITTKLPYFSVRGDEVAGYLLYDNPMGGGMAAGVFTTAVRVVCQNTLNAGITGAVEKKIVRHNEGARDYLASWMQSIYAGSLATLELMKEACNVLANKPISDVQVKWIAETVYPMPRKPTDDENSRARRPLEVRMEEWDKNCERTSRIRETVFNLYDGMGIGMDSPAVKGTAWGAWNSVAEFETYRAGGFDKAAEGLIDGDRAKRIRGAFTLALNADRWQTLDVTALGFKAVEDEFATA